MNYRKDKEMVFVAYKKGKVVRNQEGVNITLFENRTYIHADTYKEAEKIALSKGFWCVCNMI